MGLPLGEIALFFTEHLLPVACSFSGLITIKFIQTPRTDRDVQTNPLHALPEPGPLS